MLKRMLALAVMSFSCAMAALEVVSFEGGSANQSVPNMRLENKGAAVSGFTVLYYFSAADTKDVVANPLSVLEYPFDEACGIFAAESSVVLRHSKIKVDDEDDDNANSWKWYNAPEEIQTRIKNIVSGGANTVYHVVRWVKTTLAILWEVK